MTKNDINYRYSDGCSTCKHSSTNTYGDVTCAHLAYDDTVAFGGICDLFDPADTTECVVVDTSNECDTTSSDVTQMEETRCCATCAHSTYNTYGLPACTVDDSIIEDPAHVCSAWDKGVE